MGLASYGQPVMEDILKFDVESGEFSCKVSSIKETDSFFMIHVKSILNILNNIVIHIVKEKRVKWEQQN